MRTSFLMLALVLLSAAPALAAPTYSDIQVARIDDLGQPFNLKTNLYLPPGPKGSPTPLLLYIHGKGGSYNAPKDRLAQLAESLTGSGIAVATIDYRQSGRMPAMLFDTKAYIRYFRAHAGQYNLDPRRFAIWGVSRGGNLAAMLAVTGDVKTLEGTIGGNTDQSSQLAACVIYFPLTDMFLNADDKAAQMFSDYLGTSPADSAAIVAAYRHHDTASPFWKDVMRIEEVNPLNYVKKDAPPALIAVGGHDVGNVPINSSAFYEKYIETGAEAHYYSWSSGTHGHVGKDIEDATLIWVVEHLSANPPQQYR
jgi:acetyl esterase/lipase